ncbi:MAG: TatD family nuclease-associated radical SAM protein [Desulfuromonadaceae bacterium]|nr:TatD family nuclease-associated radical SAM protein [Desulfuromonas sp.]MDY0184649.1 TatD family nuclease-associated radical SAM protein [Desulfuromonadaceae bacterium]
MPTTHPALVDTHAHLDGPRFATDLDTVLERATAVGVHTIITVGCNLESSQASVALTQQYSQHFPKIYASVGVHPHDSSTLSPQILEQLRELANNEKVVAIGETGLDYFRNRSPHEVQQQAFRQQIQLARQCGKPVIIHSRDAHTDVLSIMRAENAQECGGVLHCFSGNLQVAQACLDMGFHLSFAGNITYPKNEGLREVIRNIPLERILVETDCPYLAPQSMRGKRNEPAYTVETAACIAELRGLTPHDIARITSLNAYELFGVGQVDQAVKIAYRIRNSLYLNITNRCTNSCTFCTKFQDFKVKGHQLKLEREPDTQEIIHAIGDPRGYEEVVFCGYGEPLLRLNTVIEVARWLKQYQVKVRINTDGQANLVHERNIVPELKGLVDSISISLNASDAQEYQRLCRSTYGAEGYAGIKDFIREAVKIIPQVIASAVTVPGVDIDACATIAAELGADFRERIYNEVG